MSAPTPPPMETTREVRFAVVMYGGVSLAIYINGITQELFHLARATARGAKDESGENALLFGTPANDSSNSPAKLSPTERVYRKLSYLLSDQNLLNDYRDFLYRSSVQDPSTAESQPVNQNQSDVAQELDDRISRNREPINTRFIIDIMSGTSAGGINSIYLAKALANDQQIDQLKSLWLNEGDIALLLNDQRSVADLQLTNQQPPLSLLNSRRMYLKLLASFNDMESNGKQDEKGQEPKSPYVDELDLFITATDLEGVIVPIKLSDTVVYEKRHRHVFHFKYSTFRNDFRKYNNPFLAFAARCTSSFPFAFEPMRLCDIDDVVDIACSYRKDDEFTANRGTWNAFFREKLQSDVAKRLTFEQRAFGDGGYLDNKPFSYATDTLTRRDAPVPVDRKLIYIEPSPEHPEEDTKKAGKSTDAPNALQNVKKAVLDLPMYETIREDLERVIDRNRLINRVNRITAAIERDVDHIGLSRPSLKSGEWQTFDLADMVKRFGIYYLPYRRLRIASASDELAKLVAMTAGLDESSAYYSAIRILVRAWREIKYTDYRTDGGVSADEVDQLADKILQAMGTNASEPLASEKLEQRKSAVQSELLSWLQINCPDYTQKKKTDGRDAKPTSAANEAVHANTANQFLIDFDFKYWMRRLTFIRQKLDDLYRLNWTFANKPLTEDDLRDEQKAIVTRLKKLKDRPFDYCALKDEEKEELKKTLRFLKKEISTLYSKLKSEGRKIQSLSDASGETSPIAAAIKAIKIEPALLSYLLGMPQDADPSDQQFARINEDACVIRAKKLLKHSDDGEDSDPGAYDPERAETLRATNLSEQVNTAADAIKVEFKESITDAKNGTSVWSRSRALLNPWIEHPELQGKITNGVREYLWRYFSQFDDFDQVRFPILYGTDVGESDVIEIIRISPEDAPSLIAERSEKEKRRKLAGTTLFNFGAFLDRSWRQNDIMWGRLDGAERLVTALLPDAESAQGDQVDNSKVRKALIEEAHRAILDEEFPVAGRKALGEKMTDALLEAGKDNDLVAAVNKVANNLKKASPTSRPLEGVLLQSLAEDGFLEFMRSGYQVNRKLDPEPLLRAMSRSTQVIGKIFEDIADKSGLQGKNLTWIARLGKIFWGLIEVAVPGSILRMLFIHWLKLIYLFEALLLIGGTVFVRPSIQQFGLVTFAMTLAADIGASLLHDAMLGRRKGFKWLKTLGYVVGILLGLLGLLTLFGLLGIKPIWQWMSTLHDWIVQPSRWRRWSPALIGLALFAWIMRDDLRWLWRKYTRWLRDFKGEKD